MLEQTWKHQISLKQFSLFHEEPNVFVVSQWQHNKLKPNRNYCIYRVSIFITFFVSWIFTYVKETAEGKPRWPIYLTNWGFTLCMLQSLLCGVMLTVSLIAERSANKNSLKETALKMYSLYWVINIIATPVAFTISIIYWALIFGAEGAAFTAMNFIVHGLNSILMLLDLFIVCHPVKIVHFIYPLFLALCYTIFTIVYYVAGGTTKKGSRYIYPILKWDQPGKTAGVCAGVMVLMIFLHVFTFCIYKIRTKFYEVLCLPGFEVSLSKEQESEADKAYVNKAMDNEYV